MKKVADLRIDDEIKFGSTVVVVRSKEKGKVLVSKKAAQLNHGLFSLSFYSSKYEDLMNRVQMA